MAEHEKGPPMKVENLAVGHVTHSLSTLSVSDETTSTNRHASGKKLAIRVQMLDDSTTMFQVQAKAIGKVLFEQVCRQLNLLEADYFGLEYQEKTTRSKYWLDLLKPLNRQVGLLLVEPLLRFCIKFYTPDPARLEEEYTRYLFCLQIKRDLATGSLQCNNKTAALMASYIVQASCGDFVPDDYPDHTYLSSYKFVPQQDISMQKKIMENHKKHTGQSPAEADLNLLETARHCELYGIQMHVAKDIAEEPLNLSVAHMGVVVFQGTTRINIFSWAKIRKISFKRKRFLIKLHPEGFGYYKDTVEFLFDGRNECKNFWKKCVENHGFFRCISVKNPSKSRVLSRGSSFRYSGKTQKQIIEFVRENYVKRQNFQRSQSFRQGPLKACSRSQSHSYVNSSISANPLLPIDAADWDSRSHCSTLTMHLMTKAKTDISGHHKDNITNQSHSHVTPAPVETYQRRSFDRDFPILGQSTACGDQMNMARSVSPLGPKRWNSHIHSKINTEDQSQSRVHLEKNNLGQSQSFLLCKNNSHYQVSVGQQQFGTKNSISNAYPQRINLLNSGDLESSSEFKKKEKIIASSTTRNLNMKTSSLSQESTVPILVQLEHSIPVHYSSTSFLTSKSSTYSKTLIDPYKTDKTHYTDINNICHNKYPNKFKSNEEHNISKNFDIYTTINLKKKSKCKINHISNLFFDHSINTYMLSKSNNINNSQDFPNYHFSNDRSIYSSINNQFNFHSDKNEVIDSCSCSNETKAKPKLVENTIDGHSELHNSLIQLQSQTNLKTLPSLSCANSGCSNFMHSKEHQPSSILSTRTNENYLLFGNDLTEERILTSTKSARRSSEKLERDLSSIYIYSAAQVKHKEENNCFHMKKESWLKSSSCKNLLLESEKTKSLSKIVNGFLSYNRIESPITRYQDSEHIMYFQSSHSCQDSYAIIDSKIYSSSYPGSTLRNFKHQRRIYTNKLDYIGSHDNISHDSYDVLEDTFFDNFTQSGKFRSCSVDSGNFIPSDDEMPLGNQKYRSAMDVKSKSVANIMKEIWDSQDPWYFPREKLSVKSDGSFYKKKKKHKDSQSSSQETRSDIYETKASESLCLSKKSGDSLYHTESKKSRETTKSKSSIVSICASKESLSENIFPQNFEMPMTSGKNNTKNAKSKEYLQHSSWESKNDCCVAQENLEGDSISSFARVKSFECLPFNPESSSPNGCFRKSRDIYTTFPSKVNNKTSKVHSISLQNVKIYKNARSSSTITENTIKDQKKNENQITQLSNKEFWKKNKGQKCESTHALRRKSDSENIFTFDRDKIETLISGCTQNEKLHCVTKFKNSPDYPLTPELISEFDKQVQAPRTKIVTRKEELMAKTHFEEYNPKVMTSQAQLQNVSVSLPFSHVTVERTKSDPNSLAKRGLCMTQRRNVLTHQQSIDLTLADSSDEDCFYTQIPSAPPQCKSFGKFEVPGHHVTSETPLITIKTEFYTPKSFFRECEHQVSNALKEDIPYMLHKRHVFDGNIPLPIEKKNQKPRTAKCVKSPKLPITPSNVKKIKSCNKILPVILDTVIPELRDKLLFTQNVDPSKIDILKLKVDQSIPKTELLISHCGKQREKKVLEKLIQKFSKIEPAADFYLENENTEKYNRILEQKQAESTLGVKTETSLSSREAVVKRMTSKATNKIRKGKTRITSFSSDDESLDSDDVFGSAEPIPTTLEFSPPQSRKEIEPILRIEQSKLVSAAWGRGQTMSSTEIEGSPPQCRRLAELESRYEKPRLDSIYSNALELRRISERSISIPSSEEENNISSKRASAGTRDFERNKNIQFPILFSSNIFHSEHQMPVKCEIDGNTMESLKYTLKRNDCHIGSRTEKVDYSKTRRKNNKISFEYSRARLNLSEGSGLECLYNRKSTHDSPSTDRRAKSLDIPIISKHKLPPKNAFSSKDDTFEIEEEADILEEKALYQGILNVEEELPDSVRSCEGSIPSAQVCYSHLIPDPILSSVSLDSEESDLLHRLKLIEKIALKGVKIKGRKISRMELKSGDHLILDIPKYNFDYSPLNSCNSSRKTSPGVSRASSLESTGMRKSKIRSKTSDAMELKPTIGSVIHPKKDKQNKVKGKPSYNYNDLERRLNHEKSKSLEKTEADIAKRKERQQKLYECAMKQTITMLSPVKDQLLQYPSHQNDNNVKTDGDKIIIETEFRNKTKNHVLIAKSPQKLDSSLLKFSRSFDESVCQKKLEKANRSFEDRKKSFEESEKSGIAEDFSPQSRRATTRNQFLEESGKHSKPPRMDKKSATSNTKSSHSNTPFQIESTNKTLARPLHIRSYISDRKVFANQFGFNEEIDMQAVICERRSLEILKRQSSRPEDITNDSDVSHIQSTEGSADSYVSLEENTFNFKPLLSHEDYREIIIPTTEYKEPLNESNYDTSNKCFELEVANGSTYHLTLARTKSDETTSWTTMECEEFIRSDTSENGLRAIETERDISTTDNPQALDKIGGLIFPKINTLINNSSASVENLIQQKNKQMRTFPKQSDKSKRSNSWTNGDGVATSSKFELFDWSLSQSGKEKSSVDDESSVSYSVARPFGISQDYGDFDNQKCLELKEKILIHDRKSILKNESVIDIKTNQLTSKKVSTPVLEKQSPIDFGLSNEVFQVDVEDNMLNNYPQDNNNFVNSSANISLVSKSLRKRIPENLSLAEKGPLGKSGNSGSDRSSQESKSSFDSRASLSIESKESFGTESSSCSLGLAQRRGDCLQREQQSTWKTFTIESSGSSSLGETVAHIDQESAEQMHSCIAIGELSDNDYKEHSFKEQEISNVKCQDEMIDLTTSLGYPGMTSALSGIGINSTDIVNYNAEFTVGRTLSRISERSTASEKSSVEDDVSKASTHSVSMPDESGCSYDHQPSLSSDSRSNTNLAYISDTERRTSAEMPDIPCDSATAERFPNKNKLRGSTVITGRFAVTQVDERTPEEFDRKTLLCLSNPESQDSEDWPLPEIPYDFIPVKPTELVLVVTDSDHPLPKALRWKGNMLFQSQDSKERNLNLLNGGDLPFSRNVEPHYIADANEKVPKKLVDIHKLNKEDTTYIPQYLKSKPHNLTSPPEEEKVLPYEDTSYFMLSPYKIKKQVDNTCFSRIQNDPPDCFDSALILPYCCSASRSFGDSYSLKEDIPKDTISIQPTHSLYTCCPVSAPDYISYDDSTPRYPDHNCAMWPGRKHIYGSRSSEKAAEEVFSILEEAYKDDQINVCRSFDKRPNTGFLRRCSHSSHSEEETSSFGTDLGETVRKGVQQKKCTHSSHSEDTSIGISISEWSTGTNTVHQYANLSGSDSLSAISYHSIGGKSEKPEQTVSIVNTKNTSYESSNGKGINFSCNKMFAMEDNSSDGQQKDIFLDSKTSNSKTRSDVTILTLPEKIQTATECSISNNQTFNGALQQIKQTKENKNHCDSCIGYMPLKNFRNLKKDPLILNENYVFPLTHENKKNTIIKKYSLCPTNVSPHTTENSYNEDKQTLLLPESHYFEDVLKNHQSLKLYQGEKYVCDEEVLSGYLFPTNKKCFAGYRSQELFPVQKPVTESAVIPEIFVLPNKTLLKYNSCDDTILIRSQIKLNKTKKLQHSQSFPEQFCSSDQIFSSTAESSMNQSNLVASTTSRMTCAGNNKTSTRKVNSSSFNFRSEISETYSHYYYSFPRFVSAFNQTIQSPLEKGFLKAKAKRKKRTMTKNRVWSERFGTEEGVEASTNYLSETELPEFQNNKNTQIKEEQRIQLCFCDDYHEHKLLTSSNIALHEITSNNLQYISFELTSNLAALLLHQQRIRNL